MTLKATTGRRDILDRLWRIASDTRVTSGLLCLLAATLAVAAVFPQQPAGLEDVAAEQWRAATAGAYRGVGSTLAGLGFFNATEGVWFRILMAVIAYHLLLRLAVSAQAAWSARRLGRALPPLLVCLGALLVLAGLLVESTVGWRTTDIALEPGTAAAAGSRAAAGGSSAAVSSRVLPTREGDLRVALQGVTGTASTITVTRSGGLTRTLQVAYIRPAAWGSFWMLLQGTGASLTASAQSSNRPLLLQSLASDGEISVEIHLPFRQAQTEQAFAIPTSNLTFRAVSYPSLPDKGINRPVFLVEAYRGDEETPVLSQLVEDEATLMVDDVVCTLSRAYHVVLTVAYLPGLAPVFAGGLLILAGALVAAAWRWAGRPALARAGVFLGAGLLALAAGWMAWQWNGKLVSGELVNWEAASSFGTRELWNAVFSGLAGVGLGGWLPVLVFSIPWLAGLSEADSCQPSQGWQLWTSRADAAFCISYPYLTAAVLVRAGWNVVAYAVIWRGQPADGWLLVSWLMGGVYLQILRCAQNDSCAQNDGESANQRIGESAPRWFLLTAAACGLLAALLVARQGGLAGQGWLF